MRVLSLRVRVLPLSVGAFRALVWVLSLRVRVLPLSVGAFRALVWVLSLRVRALVWVLSLNVQACLQALRLWMTTMSGFQRGSLTPLVALGNLYLPMLAINRMMMLKSSNNRVLLPVSPVSRPAF